VLGAVLVDQAADRAAGRVVDAGHAAGADGDELLLGLRGRSAQGADECECSGQSGQFLHGVLL